MQNDDGAYARAMGFMSDALMYYKLQAGETRPVVSSYKNKHVLASYFGRAQYSFKDKYLFTLLPVSMVATVLERTTVMLSFLREHLRGE